MGLARRSEGSVRPRMKVRWSEQALDDLEEIRRFISRDSPFYAERVVDSVFQAVDRLTEHPLSGRIVPEFENPGIRELILGSYRIVHRVREDVILISTISHSSRLLKPEHLGG